MATPRASRGLFTGLHDYQDLYVNEESRKCLLSSSEAIKTSFD
jgi:hypothetical protein